MESIEQLYFYSEISEKKPENIINNTNKCPFCDIEKLEGIIEKENEIIWLKNKFPTLQNTFQTVIIETSDCNASISSYENDYMRKLMRFCINKWMELDSTKKFKSVILFKNHGPLSGGSIKHSHMQIVGLNDIDYRKNLVIENFKGLQILKHDDLEVNISKQPIIGFSEFNIILGNLNNMDLFSDYIQLVIKYILSDFHKACNSYNMFFYFINGQIICKIIPRFLVSPYFVGYKIPQVHVETRLIEIKNELLRKLKE